MRKLIEFVLIACVIMPGCASESEEESLAMIGGPLELDPTEKIEFFGWWSSGAALLRLDEAESFVLWSGTNVYHKPAERGRWRQANYAELWIEPYHQIRHHQTRVGVSKIDGRVALNLEGYAPFFRVDGPPSSPEDQVIGAWIGERGSLRLDGDMTCEFVNTKATDAPVAVTRYRGSWRLDGDSLIVEPDAPNVPSTRYSLVKNGAAVTRLVGTGGTLMRLPQSGQ
jgi:hypothetical protein